MWVSPHEVAHVFCCNWMFSGSLRAEKVTRRSRHKQQSTLIQAPQRRDKEGRGVPSSDRQDPNIFEVRSARVLFSLRIALQFEVPSLGPMDAGETGYNRYSIDRSDRCAHCDPGSATCWFACWPASQWRGGGTNLSSLKNYQSCSTVRNPQYQLGPLVCKPMKSCLLRVLFTMICMRRNQQHLKHIICWYRYPSVKLVRSKNPWIAKLWEIQTACQMLPQK